MSTPDTAAPAATTGTTPPPAANSAIVTAEVRRALRSHAADPDGSPGAAPVLLLRAAAQWHESHELQVPAADGGDDVTVTVAPCATVLAVLEAVTTHDRAGRPGMLAVLTPCSTHEIGSSILARAVDHRVRHVNRWDLVRESFGARRVDPKLTSKDWRWVAESLLAAQPVGGWPRLPGPVLDFDTALRRLAAARLDGGYFGTDDPPDAASLLEWSRDGTRVASFAALPQQERDGLARWLREAAGPVAELVLTLASSGQAIDAVPLGIAARALLDPRATDTTAAMQARVRAEERYFRGDPPGEDQLRTFGEAAESLVARWLATGDTNQATAALERAEQILGELRATELAGASAVLEAGFAARLDELGKALEFALPHPNSAEVAEAEQALGRVRAHHLHHARRITHPAMAVRLVRWLATSPQPPEPGTGTVAALATQHVRHGAWVDRALAQVCAADTSAAPQLTAAYAALVSAVRARRGELDRAFAQRLAAWSPTAGETENLLLVENALERIARPLPTGKAAPLIIVIDGMSAAVGCELAEGIVEQGPWVEVGRDGMGREPAIATVPSTTAYSRASLLRGELTRGGQTHERDGFTRFWRGRPAALFHKGDLRGGDGHSLARETHRAIGDPATVVGVVLNAVDDALDRGRESGRAGWRLDDVAHLRQLLDAAALAGRPVAITADHGHVPDRADGVKHTDAGGPSTAGTRARYRPAAAGVEPGDGEVLLGGPRVLPGDDVDDGSAGGGSGKVVAVWDERIRYASRRAGYHGGAALAEMVVPVLTFVPHESLCPTGWATYRPSTRHEPTWWSGHTAPAATDPAGPPGQETAQPAPSRPPRRTPTSRSQQPDAEGLFELPADTAGPEPAASPEPSTPAGSPEPTSLGQKVTAASLLISQREFVRKAPPDAEVAALVDALDRAGGKLAVTEAATVVNKQPMRMSGYLTQVQRLLNVEGYPVLSVTDEGRTVTLNTDLLRGQFL